MRVLIFSGTTEGRRLAERLAGRGISCDVCVATEYGEAVMEGGPSINILVGRKSVEEIRALLESVEYVAVADCTHPYAQAVTGNIIKAMEGLDLPYYRVSRYRTEGDSAKDSVDGAMKDSMKYSMRDSMDDTLRDSIDDAVKDSMDDADFREFASSDDCAVYLKERDGAVLLTTGSKELSVFCRDEALRKRLVVRILPARESLDICLSNGLSGHQIIAAQGPFSEEMNLALIYQYGVKYLVTKISGRTGGFYEKISAAKKAGIKLLAIKKPEKKSGIFEYSLEEVCDILGGMALPPAKTSGDDILSARVPGDDILPSAKAPWDEMSVSARASGDEIPTARASGDDNLPPGIVIAAPKSGSGKTAFTCALISTLAGAGKNDHTFGGEAIGGDITAMKGARRCPGSEAGAGKNDHTFGGEAIGGDITAMKGARRCPGSEAAGGKSLRIKAFKCGPDYIDPLYHRRILGVPSGNLDLFFSGEGQIRELYREGNDADLSVIEGVMGLFDGLGGTGIDASTYHLAKVLNKPIVLLINAHGMGRSVLAEIKGFKALDEADLIKGVILNRITGALYEKLAPLIGESFGDLALGYVPDSPEFNFGERHLGLLLPWEVEDLFERMREAGTLLKKTVDIDRLLRLAGAGNRDRENAGNPKMERRELSSEDYSETGDKGTVFPAVIRNDKKVNIAVAKDEVFCFYYEENIRLIERLGGRPVYFSPLHDERLPDNIGALILGGGYPELMAGELSANKAMLDSIGSALRDNIPSLAECGGFMYLHETLTDEKGERHSLVGAVKGNCYYTGKLVRFGYAQFESEDKAISLKGHEFHYYDSDSAGEALTAHKPTGNKSWRCCHKGGKSLWGFPHFYYPSDPGFIESFLDSAREYERSMI